MAYSEATYVGSGEHKRVPNPLAHPALRADASDCDAVVPGISQEQERLTRVLREVLGAGQHSSLMENGWPRNAWCWLDVEGGNAVLAELRLTNSAAGQYKGYFIDFETDLVGKKARYRELLRAGGAWSRVYK